MKTTTERRSIERHQVSRLGRMLETILARNEFYRGKFQPSGTSAVDSLAELKRLSFTTKTELVQDQAKNPPFGTDLTFPVERYLRVHQTSGTTGVPLYWLDTVESWDWWMRCWKAVFDGAGVRPGDRIFFPFSFGPFVGFWSAWEAVRTVGALAIPGGGQTTHQRLKAIMDYRATVVVCTPTYALRMAAEAAKSGIDLARQSAVRITIHAGELGASIPGTKRKIEEAWGAKCYDHAGATEVGAWGFECESQPGGIHVNEEEFIAEIIDPETGGEVGDGERGELVITNLDRIGSPVIRYRTGDFVQPHHRPCPCGRPFLLLEGGILGRVDDMFIVRGVNIFPSAVENLIREFPEIDEFRVETYRREELDELKLIVEPFAGRPPVEDLEDRVAVKLREHLGLRPQVEIVAPGTLSRSEMKTKRFFRL
jgi:phenylacetate-CoA ligase